MFLNFWKYAGYQYNIYSFKEYFIENNIEVAGKILREKGRQNSVIICENSIYGNKDLKSLFDKIITPVILFPNLGNLYRKESGVKEAARKALKYVAQTNPLVYANIMMEIEKK